MSVNGLGSTSGANNTPPPSNGADPKSPEGLQGRLDDIQNGKSENPKEDLKNLQKDVEKAQQDEEKKSGGGDEDTLKMLMKLLEMIMKMVGQGGGGGEGGEEKSAPAQ
jgi:hypothetical protein